MAEALLSVLLENLTSLIQKESAILRGVNKETEKLSSTLSTICAVLEDAEEKQLTDRAVKNWLRKLKDVSFELVDILDERDMEASKLEYRMYKSTQSRKVRAVSSFIACLNPIVNIVPRYTIAKRINEVNERLDEIGNERMKFHLREAPEERHSQVSNKRETVSFVDQRNVYGREEDKDKIVEFLVASNSSNCKDRLVYPIVGMGGVGKTTLAQLVFNDERVTRNFEIKIWVCVSEDFDVKRLIKAMVKSVAQSDISDALEMDPLQHWLRNKLEGKKFFLVLDDVWNEDTEQWERLKNVLNCGSNGSSIVVTTRLKRVASIMGTIPMHELSSLSEYDCWLLFKQRAFGNESDERPNLVKIGKEIVRKCGGVPLAAKALGSLMRFKSDETEWFSVMESELWNLPQDETSILPALRLSYFHLPVQFRRCFAYCAIFPKDFVIETEQLVHLWIANDLISPKGSMDVEDIGNEICNELYRRSLFQDAKKDEDGEVYSFKMHDLVHDLAQSIMEDECRAIDLDNLKNLFGRVRHLSCTYFGSSTFGMLSEPLRTLILLGWVYGVKADEFANFHSLRAFDARRRDLPSASVSFLVKNSKHLRYLNLSGTSIRVLPESVCSLHRLQTLDIRDCSSLEKLPKKLSRLRSLRHLYIQGCSLLDHMPPNVGQLTCLRTLSMFIVGSRNGCHVDELGSLSTLSGELEILQLERVTDPVDARNANLVQKVKLKSLILHWDLDEMIDASLSQENNHAQEVFEALEPPLTLRYLRIAGYGGRHFPHWFDDELILGNVVRIVLDGCKNCMELPKALGKLSLLREIEIYYMDLPQFVDYGELGSGRFLSLERLRIRGLTNLQGLSKKERTEIFPILTSLWISDCPKLTLHHCLQSIKHLHIGVCNEATLKSIPHLQTLTSLEIDNNDDSVSFPPEVLQNLSNLKKLYIGVFNELQHLHSEMLTGLCALEELRMWGCVKLEHFPMGIFQDLNKLKTLEIKDSLRLKSLSNCFEDLAALEILEIGGCPVLTALPEALQHLTSLRSFVIYGLTNLELLPEWFGNLTSLQSLTIRSCPKLESLPTSMQKLTNLQHLQIRNCPKLEQRCDPRGSEEDWHKIAHIPRVQIDSYY